LLFISTDIYLLTRSRRADSLDEGPTERSDRQMCQSAKYVCHKGLQKECHGWHAYESTPNAECKH